jgi:lambda family phage portal protein
VNPRRPNFVERALASVAPSLALERALARERLALFGYDSANPDGKRGSSGGMAKNAGSETPRMAQDRLKMIWEARDLERNMPVIRCALDRVSQYVCGQIRYQAQTGDDEVDAEYEAYVAEWMRSQADLTGRHNFRMLVELAFRSMLRDGDFGFRKVRQGAVLRLQAIEADRIGDPNKVSSQTDETMVQGIHVDPVTGAPAAYDIYRLERKSTRYVFEDTIPAADFLFLHKPLRTDEYRSVSWLAPITAQARDLYEMFAFERGAAKWAASIAGVIRVTDPMGRGANGSAGVFDGVATNGTPTSAVEANKLLRLKPNEDVTPFNTGSRPSGAFIQYIESALRDIAMGLNVPYGFFNMAQFGGATVRLEAQQLDRTFGRFQEILTHKLLDPSIDDVLNLGIATKLIPPSKNWRGRRWQFGPQLTADTGYDTDADLQLLSYGLKTASEIAGKNGRDFNEVLTQTVKEIAMTRDAAAEQSVPMEMVASARFPGATDQLAAVAQALTPQVNPTAADLGDGGVKNLVTLLESVANGTLPREEAINVLITVYEFAPEVAEAVVPTVQALAVKANMPAAPAAPGGKPKTEAKPAKET